MAFDVGTRPETPQIDWELGFRYINNLFRDWEEEGVWRRHSLSNIWPSEEIFN